MTLVRPYDTSDSLKDFATWEVAPATSADFGGEFWTCENPFDYFNLSKHTNIKFGGDTVPRLEPPTGFQMMQKYSKPTHVWTSSTAFDSTI